MEYINYTETPCWEPSHAAVYCCHLYKGRGRHFLCEDTSDKNVFKENFAFELHFTGKLDPSWITFVNALPHIGSRKEGYVSGATYWK